MKTRRVRWPGGKGGLGVLSLCDPNELIPFVADPNVSIQESKAFTANLRAGRFSFGRRAATDGFELRQPEPPSSPPRDKPGVRHPKNLPVQEPLK